MHSSRNAPAFRPFLAVLALLALAPAVARAESLADGLEVDSEPTGEKHQLHLDLSYFDASIGYGYGVGPRTFVGASVGGLGGRGALKNRAGYLIGESLFSTRHASHIFVFERVHTSVFVRQQMSARYSADFGLRFAAAEREVREVVTHANVRQLDVFFTPMYGSRYLRAGPSIGVGRTWAGDRSETTIRIQIMSIRGVLPL